MAKDSKTAIAEATKSQVNFSEHGNALGAAGHHSVHDEAAAKDDILIDAAGESVFIEKPKDGFPEIAVNLSWDRIEVAKEPEGFIKKLFKKGPETVEEPVDLDLGCLYQLKNGERGCLQAFGELFGAMNEPPFIFHKGDERTGDTEGVDEQMIVNGAKWDEIERVLFYIYIYQGAPDWMAVKPTLFIDVPGREDLKMTPHAKKGALVMCAVGIMENLDGGINLKNHSEYFAGHAEMDRAFGFGLEWEDGEKS